MQKIIKKSQDGRKECALMLNEEGLIEDIIQYLGVLESYIYISNKQGLSNINRFSENFFGGLLNIIYDLNLKNTNYLKMNLQE